MKSETIKSSMRLNSTVILRKHIIYEILKSYKYVKTIQIVHICKDDYGIIVTERSIQKDIQKINEDSVLIKYSYLKKAYSFSIDGNESFTNENIRTHFMSGPRTF